MDPGSPTSTTVVWEYVAPDPQSLYSGLLSGAHRLPNGNTLIAAGISGRIREVGAGNDVVWEFTNPYLEEEDPLSSERLAAAFGAGSSAAAEAPRSVGAAGRERRGDARPARAGGRGGSGGRGNGGNEAAGGGRGSRSGGPRAGSIYRATRIPVDHPGLRPLQAASGG
jgi:hypothetical protein